MSRNAYPLSWPEGWKRTKNREHAKFKDAMRAIERHGGATILDRAFLGFAALPERATQSWRETLGIAPEAQASRDIVEERFRTLVKLYHPDVAGENEENRARFEAIMQAREAARQELN